MAGAFSGSFSCIFTTGTFSGSQELQVGFCSSDFLGGFPLAGAFLGSWELFGRFPSWVPFQALRNFKGFHLRNFSRISETKMV